MRNPTFLLGICFFLRSERPSSGEEPGGPRSRREGAAATLQFRRPGQGAPAAGEVADPEVLGRRRDPGARMRKEAGDRPPPPRSPSNRGQVGSEWQSVFPGLSLLRRPPQARRPKAGEGRRRAGAAREGKWGAPGDP